MLIRNWISNGQVLPKRLAVNAELIIRPSLAHLRHNPHLAPWVVKRSELDPGR